MKEVFYIDGVRTAIGRMGGALSSFRPEELAAFALKGLKDRMKFDPSLIDDILIGHACTNNAAVNIGRWAALKAGYPLSVPAQTVERQCGSALQTVNTAAAYILAGFGDIYVAGGCESWSRQPYMMERQESPFSLSPPAWVARQTGHDEESNVPMGTIAEILAEEFKISREEQDAFGLRSQTRAIEAIKEGLFKDEIVPVAVPQKKGEAVIFDTDEHPRATTMEKLAQLRPAFKKNGTVTAGSSSGLNDGGVAVLLMSVGKGLRARREARRRGSWPPPSGRGSRSTWASRRSSPVEKALKKAGLKLEDMDVVECNEAFASQTLAVMKLLERNGHTVVPERWNPHGGAIAFGHPNGMSGGRLAMAVVNELHRVKGRYGLATLCIGGGQGIAAIFERA